MKNNPLSVLALAALTACGDDSTQPMPDADETGTPVVDVLVPGSPLQGSNGLAFAADGRLYVAGAYANRISLVDPVTGTIDEVFGADGSVRTPDDVAVAGDGTLYWTSLLTGEIGRRRPDGTIDVAAQLPPGVNPIEVAPDGRVFVGVCVFGDALYEIDPSGAIPPRTIAQGIGGGCALNGMELGGDGRLYGAQPALGRIAAVDVDSGALEVIATGFSPTLFAIAFDADGVLHAVDGASLYAVENGIRRLVATLPFGADNVIGDADGSLLVSSVGTAEIVRVTADGTITPVVRGGLYFPQGLTTDGADGLLVVSAAGITRYTDAGAFDRPISFNPFAATTLEARGERWVSSLGLANLVSVWDASSATPTELGRDFRGPVDARALGDDVLVAEAGAGVVTRVSIANPTQRTAVASIAGIAGLAVAGDAAFATDAVTGSVLQIIEGGVPLSEPRRIADGLQQPRHLAATATHVIVVETGTGRVVELDRVTGVSRELYGALTPVFAPPGAPPPASANVTVDDAGTVYVSDPQTNRIVRITPR